MFDGQSFRFDVKIDPKNLDNYEISFLDLIKRDLLNGNIERNKDETDKVLKRVKELEDAYGPVAVVKGKRIHINDFVDLGNGYDADDPFIDDSGNDEVLAVAPDLMTVHGGFFINRESLKLNEGSFVIERIEGRNELMDIPKQEFHATNINKKSKSQKLLSQARKRLTTSSKSNSSMRRVVTSSNEKIEEIINNVVSTNNVPEIDKTEIVAKMTKKGAFEDLTQEKETNGAQINNVAIVEPTKILELPSGLPDGVLEKIRSLMLISENFKIEGKKIEPNFDTILLELDTLLHINQKGKKSLRTHTLRYLGQITNLKYNWILRRLLKIKDSKKQKAMKPLFIALEDAIKEAMVESVAKYEQAVVQYVAKIETQKLLSQSTEESVNSSIEQQSERDSESKAKSANKIQSPKRYFKWTITCKSLLFELVCEELEAFRISNNKGVPEEYIHKFFTSSVINLFPPKWMTVSQLMKMTVPLLTEFKNCVLNGKEFTSFIQFKQKVDQKPNNNQNGAIALQQKIPIVSITKCHSINDLNDAKSKAVSSQTKKMAPPQRPSTETHIKTDQVRPSTTAGLLVKVPKTTPSPVPLRAKEPIRSSSLHSPSRTIHSVLSPLVTKTQEPVKRYSDGSMVLSPISMLPKLSPDNSMNHGYNMTGISQLNSHNNDPSLSYLQNYLYPHNNHTENHCRHAITNHSSASNLVPHCSQQTLDHQQQHQKQQQQQQQHNHPQQKQHQQQFHQHHHYHANEFVHSSPYNVLPDNIARAPNRLQKVPDLSTIFSTPIEIRSSSMPPCTQQTVQTNHNNLQQTQQTHNKYMGILPDYGAQVQYHHHPMTHIDLTGDSPTNSGTNTQQLSPNSIFINTNTAHCSNPRNF